ncbi:MAG: alpha/beta fold hydrolase [Myxococcota bacterium]
MPKLFVHGNPETAALWNPLFDALRAKGVDDLEALSPPGFGAPVPADFAATREAYRDWLIGEIEARGGAADLVGHDWGAGHVLGTLAERPDLFRSWATDCAGLVHEDYVWHDMALEWQKPEIGEQAVAGMLESPLEDRLGVLAAFGIPDAVAREIAAAQGPEMSRCVLSLYRSAAQPAMKELGLQLGSSEQRPGRIFYATGDPYAGTREMCESVAGRLGAGFTVLEGRTHWWMFGELAPVADALIAHWDAA